MTFRIIGRATSSGGSVLDGHTHLGLIPGGGVMGQFLAKISSADYATGWVNAPTGGTSGGTSGDTTVSRRIYNAVNHGILI